MTMTDSDQRLKIEVADGRLIISMGVERLDCDRDRLGIQVSDHEGFARDVARELAREDKIGDTPVGLCLDAAIYAAINDGSLHARRIQTEKCNVCGRELRREDELKVGACAVCMNE